MLDAAARPAVPAAAVAEPSFHHDRPAACSAAGAACGRGQVQCRASGAHRGRGRAQGEPASAKGALARAPSLPSGDPTPTRRPHRDRRHRLAGGQRRGRPHPRQERPEHRSAAGGVSWRLSWSPAGLSQPRSRPGNVLGYGLARPATLACGAVRCQSRPAPQRPSPASPRCLIAAAWVQPGACGQGAGSAENMLAAGRSGSSRGLLGTW